MASNADGDAPVEQNDLNFSSEVNARAWNEQTPKSKALPSASAGPSFYLTPSARMSGLESSVQDEEFSITNPFETHNTLDSLHQPSFSPSVFNMSEKRTDNNPKTPKSFWSIDQIAIMKPVDIDLSKLHQQQSCVRMDYTTEMKAQKAIDDFFANHVNMSSPWSSSKSSHYLAIISPSPACIRKAQESARKKFESSPYLQSHKKDDQEKRPPVEIKKKHQNSVATQTTVTIPWSENLDIFAKYATYTEPAEENQNNDEVFTNSSLRRKLFFQDAGDLSDMEFSDDPLTSPTHNHRRKSCEEGKFSSSPAVSPIGTPLSIRFRQSENVRRGRREDLSPPTSPIYPHREPSFARSRPHVRPSPHPIEDASPLGESPTQSCFCRTLEEIDQASLSPIQPVEATKVDLPFESTIVSAASSIRRSLLNDDDAP